jgi:hypothetical protein
VGEYIYRRTSHVSIVELPSGEKVPAVHIRYAYKPYHSWSGDDDNKRMRRTATLAVANANRHLERNHFDPSGFKYAVTEDDKGSIAGGTILRWSTNVPQLISDYWDKHVVGCVPWPCPECSGLLRRQEEHANCAAAQREKQEERNRQYTAEAEERARLMREREVERVSSTFAI